jgi:hypothetical protein
VTGKYDARRDVEVQVHNALLEAQQEEGWRRAPLMTCPNGHSHICDTCANEFRWPDGDVEVTEP